MKMILSAIALILSPLTAIAQEQCIVMLHGLARTKISFAPMALVLESNGYAEGRCILNRGHE